MNALKFFWNFIEEAPPAPTFAGVYDSFTDAHKASLYTHTPEVGTGWVKHSGTGEATIQYGAVSGLPLIRSLDQTASDDYFVEAVYNVTFNSMRKLYVRLNESAVTTYCLQFASNSTTSIQRIVDGAFSGSSSGYATPDLINTLVTVRLSCELLSDRVRLKAYINGTLVLTWDDTSALRIVDKGFAGFGTTGAFPAYGMIESCIINDLECDDYLISHEPFDKFVIQTAGATTPINVRGSYSGTVTGIEAKVVDHTTGATVVDWADLSGATIANGCFFGVIQAPKGGWYKTLVRAKNNTSLTYTQANKWGVGYVILGTGQSNMARWGAEDAAATPWDDRFVLYDVTYGGWHTGGRLAHGFGNAMTAALDCPVMLVNTGVDSTSLMSSTVPGDPGNWLTTTHGSWTGFVQAHAVLQLYTYGAGPLIWLQGEQDARFGRVITTAEYLGGMRTLFDRFRTEIGNPNAPIFVIPLLYTDQVGMVDEKWNNVRAAHFEILGDDNVYYGGCGIGLPQGGTHYDIPDGYVGLSRRCAHAIMDQMGIGGDGLGPVITGYTAVSSTVFDVTIEHDEGTDISPFTGITGFYVFDNSTPVTISSAVRQNATTVRLTTASTVASPDIYYGYGYTIFTSPVVDNTTLGVPLRAETSPIESTGEPPIVVYPEISATVAASSTSAVSATVTTDTAGGTIYGVLSESATVMAASAIKSGADDSATVTDAGDYTLGETGLATWTQYYWHIVHEDAGGLMSNVLAIPVRTLDISIPLAFSDTAPATLLTVQVWSKVPKKADVEGLY